MKTSTSILSLMVLSASALLLAQTTPVKDPVAFVTDVYKHYAANKEYDPPTNIYTKRLAALFAADRKKSKGEVGCIDFDFWTNSQDYEIKNMQVSGKDVPGHTDQKLVIAKFNNIDRPEEIHFTFMNVGGQWQLDDVQSLTPKYDWTLSKILQCKY